MLNSKQRSFLRSLATNEPAIFQIGKGQISDNMVSQLSDALLKREIIKISVLETAGMSAKEALSHLSDLLDAEPVCAVGNKLVLYRPSKDKKITLP